MPKQPHKNFFTLPQSRPNSPSIPTHQPTFFAPTLKQFLLIHIRARPDNGSDQVYARYQRHSRPYQSCHCYPQMKKPHQLNKLLQVLHCDLVTYTIQWKYVPVPVHGKPCLGIQFSATINFLVTISFEAFNINHFKRDHICKQWEIFYFVLQCVAFLAPRHCTKTKHTPSAKIQHPLPGSAHVSNDKRLRLQ